MEQIAIISDIHGNLTALQAVLADIRSRNISRIFCLGDIVGKGPSSDLAVDLVRTHCEKVVRGNWDEFITGTDELDMIKWHRSLLGEERLDYLASLPFCIEFRMSGKLIRLFHASPRSVNERIQPWDDYGSRLSLFESSVMCGEPLPADVAGYGDIHNAYLQHLEGKVLLNAGSVGNPLDLTQASYVILEGEYGSGTAAPLNIQFVRVPYDIELAVSQAEASGMPDMVPYIRELRTAEYRGRT
ncbi:metallophosphatase family protein [Paenibacillus sp. PK3_47]|uniref:metallophosphoesterase family protein n=1 Tax=Paenibacillus sp. PK3_47 TaxID=2072642 RepID=UPI00201D5EB2|nr:metallophosphoesterase family protein [Paenibacillus sp. PK3_47]UQZ36258.1 metallophosphatase family protein [Paenibacillus sp. PK3_47]